MKNQEAIGISIFLMKFLNIGSYRRIPQFEQTEEGYKEILPVYEFEINTPNHQFEQIVNVNELDQNYDKLITTVLQAYRESIGERDDESEFNTDTKKYTEIARIMSSIKRKTRNYIKDYNDNSHSKKGKSAGQKLDKYLENAIEIYDTYVNCRFCGPEECIYDYATTLNCGCFGGTYTQEKFDKNILNTEYSEHDIANIMGSMNMLTEQKSDIYLNGNGIAERIENYSREQDKRIQTDPNYKAPNPAQNPHFDELFEYLANKLFNEKNNSNGQNEDNSNNQHEDEGLGSK